MIQYGSFHMKSPDFQKSSHMNLFDFLLISLKCYPYSQTEKFQISGPCVLFFCTGQNFLKTRHFLAKFPEIRKFPEKSHLWYFKSQILECSSIEQYWNISISLKCSPKGTVISNNDNDSILWKLHEGSTDQC